MPLLLRLVGRPRVSGRPPAHSHGVNACRRTLHIGQWHRSHGALLHLDAGVVLGRAVGCAFLDKWVRSQFTAAPFPGQFSV